ncbi:hypothetical protein GGR53DRAFT_465739 [Hypoxylon sp. FL1150]|nr:hypothetical protein GGR53DRAFT_465739 [Hypoxylon sp. FL1150]
MASDKRLTEDVDVLHNNNNDADVIQKLKDRGVSEVSNQDPDATIERCPAGSAPRTTVQELTGGDRNGEFTIRFSTSAFSSPQLKRYLDQNYPDQYHVQWDKLKRDEFTVTIRPRQQQPPGWISRIFQYPNSHTSSGDLDQKRGTVIHRSSASTSRSALVQEPGKGDPVQDSHAAIQGPLTDIQHATVEEPAEEMPNRNSDSYTSIESLPSNTKGTRAKSTQGHALGTLKVKIHTTIISASELKQYLDRDYAKQYKIVMKSDVFHITITQAVNPATSSDTAPAVSRLYEALSSRNAEFVSFEEDGE